MKFQIRGASAVVPPADQTSGETSGEKEFRIQNPEGEDRRDGSRNRSSAFRPIPGKLRRSWASVRKAGLQARHGILCVISHKAHKTRGLIASVDSAGKLKFQISEATDVVPPADQTVVKLQERRNPEIRRRPKTGEIVRGTGVPRSGPHSWQAAPLPGKRSEGGSPGPPRHSQRNSP